MQLSESLQNRNNGLTQARLILALFVLFDHTFAINGLQRPNIFKLPISLSEVAVWLFIFLSGLLCCRSSERHSTHRYLGLRLGRLMPGYWACLILTSLIAIPLFQLIGVTGSTEWNEIPGIIFGFFGKNALLIQGEFAPNGWLNSLPVQAINGSLWTLQPEFMGYIIILLITPLFSSNKFIAVTIFSIFDFLIAFRPNVTRKILDGLLGGYGFELANNSYLKLAIFLLSGMIFYQFRNRITLRPSLAVSALGILILSTFIHYKIFQLLLPVLMPYIFIVFCACVNWPWKADQGDLSYGFYLYSFPVQQIIFSFSELSGAGFSLSLQIILSISIVMPLAWLSWTLIEKPSLGWISRLSLNRQR